MSLTNYGKCEACTGILIKSVSVFWPMAGIGSQPGIGSPVEGPCPVGFSSPPAGYMYDDGSNGGLNYDPASDCETAWNDWNNDLPIPGGPVTADDTNGYGQDTWLEICTNCTTATGDGPLSVTWDPVTCRLVPPGVDACTDGFNPFTMDSQNTDPRTGALALLATVDLDDLTWGDVVIFGPNIDGDGYPTNEPQYNLYTAAPGNVTAHPCSLGNANTYPSAWAGPIYYSGGGYTPPFAPVSETISCIQYWLCTKFTILLPGSVRTCMAVYPITGTSNDVEGPTYGDPTITAPAGTEITMEPDADVYLGSVFWDLETNPCGGECEMVSQAPAGCCP